MLDAFGFLGLDSFQLDFGLKTDFFRILDLLIFLFQDNGLNALVFLVQDCWLLNDVKLHYTIEVREGDSVKAQTPEVETAF
jgi:hypothetical protein